MAGAASAGRRSAMDETPGHIAFTPSVKAMQTARGSRTAYARMEARGISSTLVDAALMELLEQIDSAYLATASADGRPYVQHRGGPRGFIKALDAHTLAFADYSGNRQYITTGNLAENDRALLFLMDYQHARRVKVWGRARMTGDADLIARLMPRGYQARAEQALLFAVEAWDANCSQHIPRKFDGADVVRVVEQFEARLAALEAENAALKAELKTRTGA